MAERFFWYRLTKGRKTVVVVSMKKIRAFETNYQFSIFTDMLQLHASIVTVTALFVFVTTRRYLKNDINIVPLAAVVLMAAKIKGSFKMHLTVLGCGRATSTKRNHGLLFKVLWSYRSTNAFKFN